MAFMRRCQVSHKLKKSQVAAIMGVAEVALKDSSAACSWDMAPEQTVCLVVVDPMDLEGTSANVPYAPESQESPEHWETKWQYQALQELRQFSRNSLGAVERGMEQPGVI